MIERHQFREDSWFRLNVFPIQIPPLRERKSDIPALLQHFITLKSKELKLPAIPTLAPGAIDVLMEYHWPGNIRKFGNIVERALILHPTGPLSFEHLNLSAKEKTPQYSEHAVITDNLDEAMSNHIRRVLAKTNGKIHGKGGAAELLGIHANTLRNRMNKLGIAYGRKGKGELAGMA